MSAMVQRTLLSIERRRCPHQLAEILGRVLGVFSTDNGANNGDAVDSLELCDGLVEDTLAIGSIDAADADGLDVGDVLLLAKGEENVAQASSADDGFGVFLPVCLSAAGNCIAWRASHVGVAKMVPRPR